MGGYRLPVAITAQVPDPLINRVLGSICDVLNRVVGVAVVNGHHVRGVELTAATPKRITHGLGRVPLGWVVTDVDAAATLYRTSWDEQTLTLYPSANATVSLWVF